MNQEKKVRHRPATAQRKQELLESICTYVDENLERQITLQLVADRFGISISTVTQLFQYQSGTTFHRFLTERRMAAARDLIGRGVPLEKVGKCVGYTDHSSFYRAFRQQFGIAPRDFKRGIEE